MAGLQPVMRPTSCTTRISIPRRGSAETAGNIARIDAAGGLAFRATSFGHGYTGGMSEDPKRRKLRFLALLLAACAFVAAFASYRNAAQNSADYEGREHDLQDLKLQVEELKSHIEALKPAASKSP